MPSDNVKSTRTPTSIKTRTTYQRRTKGLLRKQRTGSPEVLKIETITSQTVHSNKTNHESNVQNTRRFQSRQCQNYPKKSPSRIFSKKERLPSLLLTMLPYPETPIFINIWSTHKLNNTTLVEKNIPLKSCLLL